MDRGKQIRPAEFIALMAFIMLLTAVAIDIMLPAFDNLRAYLGVGQDSTAIAQIVTFFFMGQIGQIAFGPICDRYGRLPMLRFGFALYIIGCVATVLVPNINWILAARFVVGMGAAAMSVSAIASVRDRFEGDQMSRIMSLIFTIFLGVPIVAPFLGSAILSISSWQVVFLTPAVIGVGVLIWSFRLTESLKSDQRQSLELPNLLKSVRQVAGNQTFIRYAGITTILFAAFSSYVGSVERIIGTIYGRPELFVLIFASVGITMAILTYLNTYLVQRFGTRRTIRSLVTAYMVVATLLLALTLAQNGQPNILVFFAGVAVLQAVYVSTNNNSNALALEPLGKVAGTAAALYGTSFLTIGALLGSVIDRLLVDSVVPLAVAYLLGGLIASALVYSERTSVTVARTNPTSAGLADELA